MPITYKQSTVIHLDNSALEFMGYEAPPVLPERLLACLSPECSPVSVYSKDGTETYWYSDKSILRIAGGMRTWWYPKPTIQNAVEYAWGIENQRASSFQFHRDGSVTAHCFGANYYWSMEPVESEPVEGDQAYDEACYCPRCEGGGRSDSECSDSE